MTGRSLRLGLYHLVPAMLPPLNFFTFATLFTAAQAASGGFIPSCTVVSYEGGSQSLIANCNSPQGVVQTSVNLNKCVKLNGNKLQCAHKFVSSYLSPVPDSVLMNNRRG